MSAGSHEEGSLSRARRRVLDAVRENGDAPISLGELSAQTGSHPNTLREHLTALIDGGLVTSDAAVDGGRRGRPALRYRSVAPKADAVGAAAIVMALAEEVAELPEAASVALRAGRRWAAVLDAEPSPDLLGQLTALGFDPVRVDEGIVLRSCPVAELADAVPGVICRMHLGALQASGGSDAIVDLVAWGHPDGCLIRTPSESRGA
ncbi:Predicted transcriptional regulator, ArsR family [Propioniciclava tarda]|nr:Predicted transcriptional regulator, ArsR family [Propioniciclava tarda]